MQSRKAVHLVQMDGEVLILGEFRLYNCLDARI